MTTPPASGPNPDLTPRRTSGVNDFGDLLTTRADSVVQRVFTAILAIVCTFAAFMFLMVALSPSSTSPPGSPPFGIGARIVCFVFGALLAFGAKKAASSLLSVYRFYEHGATRSILGRVVQAVEYARAESLCYHVTRHYTNGVYTGTNVRMDITPRTIGGAKAKALVFYGKHREKPDGVLSRTFIQKNFKGEDELDAIKNLISAAMVQSWLAQGEFKVAWGSYGFLTPRGLELALKKGPAGTFPYASLGQARRDEQYMRVDIENAPIKFLLLNLNSTNLWPGLMLVELMKASGQPPTTKG